MNCRVSVAIASYNAGRFLEAAVRSALRQTVADIEVIVVDDGSGDESPGIARRLAVEDSRVRFEQLPDNRGPGGARNRALELARGEWFAILDSDDLFDPDRLRRMLDHAAATGADMVADDLLIFAEETPEQRTAFLGANARLQTITLEDYLRRTVMYGDEPDLGFLKPMIRIGRMRDAAVRYDPALRIAEDDNLVLRLLAAGLRYEFLPIPGYHYRKHGASISHRLNVPAVEAMWRANLALEPAIARCSPLAARNFAQRMAMLANVRAFEHFRAAMLERRPMAAVKAMLARPGMIPLLRMPIATAWRRLLGRAA